MVLDVKIPNCCLNEQRYVLEVVLGDFLGLEFNVHVHHSNNIEITLPGKEAVLIIDVSFFHEANKHWLKPKSLPSLPLCNWNLDLESIDPLRVEKTIPVLYGKPGLKINEKSAYIFLDIFGSIFFMLSRYEEVIIEERDEHGRFIAANSIAFKENFLQRPIVNEYIEVLWEVMFLLWPTLKRKKNKPQDIVSCDVDHPIDYVGYSLTRTIRRVGARLIRDRSPKLAVLDFFNFLFKILFDSHYFDQYMKSIFWIIDVNDSLKNKVSFYFIPIQTDAKKDDKNDIRQDNIVSIIERILLAGHNIGIHPGYNTFKCRKTFNASVNAFNEALSKFTFESKKFGGRQHYLRFDVTKTPIIWAENDLLYDSSLGYAEAPGYRAGVCLPYIMYDLIERKRLNILQLPLIAMEASVISQKYLGLGYSDSALKKFIKLRTISHKMNGTFTLLWHNSELITKEQKELYYKVLTSDVS